MARAEYVHRRTGTTSLHYERRVPPDLKDHPHSKWHGKQWAVRQSLKTADMRQANEAARKLSVHWDELFQAERDRLNPTVLEVVTRDMADILAARIRSRILTQDDATRYDRTALLAFLRSWDQDIPPFRYLTADEVPEYLVDDPAWPAYRGMRPDQLQRLTEIHTALGRLHTGESATGSLYLATGYADDETRALGFLVNWERPDNRPALLTIMRAATNAWLDRGRKDRGEVVDTPVAPAFSTAPVKPKTPTKAKHTIMDALALWKADKKRVPKTAGVFERHADMFRDMMGDPPLESLTKGMGYEFRDKVQAWAVAEGRTASTATKVLATVGAMLRLGLQRDWLQVDVLADVTINHGGAEGEDRLPWAPQDLPTLFNSSVFTAYELPTTKYACLDAAYWVPLMLAYSGARPSEVAQLWTDDVFETPSGGLAIEFRANPERGQRLKKAPKAKVSPSWRVTPVHDRLIELGFADYWKAIAAHGVGKLFPMTPTGGQNGAIAPISKWFLQHKKAQGFTEQRKDLHSFRHTVRTELGLAGVSGDLSKAITGHAAGDVHTGVYGSTMRRRADDLRPFINKLTYPGLDLRRVFSKPAWHPATR
nr:site-specific integrase [Variovorax boronicumulans]